MTRSPNVITKMNGDWEGCCKWSRLDSAHEESGIYRRVRARTLEDIRTAIARMMVTSLEAERGSILERIPLWKNQAVWARGGGRVDT